MDELKRQIAIILEIDEVSDEDILDYYKYTKIYKTLKLCLNPDISNRLFIIF